MPLSRELQSQLPAVAVQGIIGSSAATVTAAGTTQATATVLSSQFSTVTTGGAAGAPFAGVILPTTSQPGDDVDVMNATSVNICVYPPSGGKLNGLSANTPLVMAANRMHSFNSVDGTSWGVDSI